MNINDQVYYEFVNVSPTIRYVLKHIPKVSEREFLENIKKGDVITAQLNKENFTSTARFLTSRTMGLAQGGVFTTIKMATGDNTVIGYGTEVGTKLDKNRTRLRERPIKRWIKHYDNAVLIRIPELTDEQKETAVKYMRSKKGLKYDTKQLTSSAFKRINLRSLEDNPHQDPNLEDPGPQFCSTIIAYAFKKSGINLHFINDIDNIWPRDFLLSPHTIKICQLK